MVQIDAMCEFIRQPLNPLQIHDVAPSSDHFVSTSTDMITESANDSKGTTNK